MKRHRHGWFVLVLVLVGMYTARSIAPTRPAASAGAPERYSYLVFILGSEIFNEQGRLEALTSELYIITPDGGQWANLTKGDYSAGGTTWSPDGKQLAFVGNHVSGDNALSSIYLLDIDERYIKPLTEGRTADLRPAWSPDGRHIAFMRGSSRSAFGFSICTVRVRDGEITQLTPQVFLPSALSWSLDGRYLLYGVSVSGTQAQSFWVDAKDGRIIDEFFLDDAGYDGAAGSQPELSPDGERIVFVNWEANRLAIVPTEGGEYFWLTPRPLDRFTYSASPTWSPDGTQVAFHSNQDREREGADYDLYVINADGTGLQRITYLPPGMSASSPKWSPWLDEPLDLDWEPTPWSVGAE